MFSYLNYRKQHPIQISDVPYQVLVVCGNEYCSGSLIFSRIVITVASCFKENEVKCSVKVGSNTVTGLGQVIPVLERKVHEYFRHETPLNNDIALLVLERNVIFGSNVQKIIVVDSEVILRVGTTLDVTGWGGGSNTPIKNIHRLLISEMKVTTVEECVEKYEKLKTQSNFCARYIPERRLSDNGGAAVYKEHDVDLLVGILSYGASFTKENECIALFTNVSYFHRWIVLNSKRLLVKHCIEESEPQYLNYYEYNDTVESYDDDVGRGQYI